MPNGEPEEQNTPWSWITTTLMTTLFLVVWAATEWLIHWIFKKLPLEGLDAWLGICLQVGFALATLVPIGLWCYREFGIMYYRSRRDVRAARREFENEGNADDGNEDEA
jgi:hypothetical protein